MNRRRQSAIEVAKGRRPLHLYDVALVRTVTPGFGGQNGANAALAIEAGADAIVAGSAIFGSGDYVAAIARLRSSELQTKDVA